jgi:hypothetical protein
MSKFIGMLIWSLAAAGFAQAGNSQADSQDDQGDRDHHRHHHPVAAPEIDPAAAGSALTLLAGGLAVVRGRRRKK